jgi:hypothetical protein
MNAFSPTRTTELLTRQDVQRALKCSRSTVERLNLPIVRIGRLVRYRPEDVQRVIDAGAVTER